MHKISELHCGSGKCSEQTKVIYFWQGRKKWFKKAFLHHQVSIIYFLNSSRSCQQKQRSVRHPSDARWVSRRMRGSVINSDNLIAPSLFTLGYFNDIQKLENIYNPYISFFNTYWSSCFEINFNLAGIICNRIFWFLGEALVYGFTACVRSMTLLFIRIQC